jgi:hypothetical protein
MHAASIAGRPSGRLLDLAEQDRRDKTELAG